MEKDQVQPTHHPKILGGESTQEIQGVSMKPPTFSLEAGPSKNPETTQKVDTSKFDNVELFIYKYAASARMLEQNHGVPALITLGQGALESGWGKSAIGNNLFGIKAGKGWEGKKQLVTTHEYHATNDKGDRYPEVISIKQVTEGKYAGKYKYTVKDYFRDYDTVEEGLLDHSQFLNKYKRYAAAFNTETPEDFALAVAAGGYATSPEYGEKLIAVMNTVRKRWPAAAGTIPAGNAKKITGGRPVEPQTSTPKNGSQKPTLETAKIDPAAKSGKYQILHAVGDGAPNQSADILVVKALLLKAGYPVLMIPTLDARDIDHIRAYQKETFGWKSPDGIVDPRGKTFKALAGGLVQTEQAPTTPQAAPTAKPKTAIPTGQEVTSIAERLYSAMHGTFFGTGWGSNEGEIVAALELLNRDGQKIEALKKAYQSKYQLDLVVDLKAELSDSLLWGKQESNAVGLLSPRNSQQVQHNSGTTTHHSGQQSQSGKQDDSTTSSKIESMFDSYAQMKIKHGDKVVSVVAPYYINSDKSGRKSRAEGARAGNARVQQLLKDLRASGKLASTAIVAKASPSELVAILEEAVNRGLVTHESAAMHQFLSKYGLSTDCSGFVSQTLNFLMDGNKVVDDKDNLDPDNTNAASLQGGNGDIQKISRSELRPGDTMHLNGHIRIIVEVTTEDKIIYYKTAESTAKKHAKTGQDGFMKRWWKFDGKTQYSTFENPNSVHPASDNVNWAETTESNTFGRYKKLKSV